MSVATKFSTICQALVQYRWRIIAGLLLAALLLIGFVASMPPAPTLAEDSPPHPDMTPESQSLLDYLRPFDVTQPPRPAPQSSDPTQRGVHQYLDMHEHGERSPAPWDAAVQALFDYIRAHSR